MNKTNKKLISTENRMVVNWEEEGWGEGWEEEFGEGNGVQTYVNRRNLIFGGWACNRVHTFWIKILHTWNFKMLLTNITLVNLILKKEKKDFQVNIWQVLIIHLK